MSGKNLFYLIAIVAASVCFMLACQPNAGQPEKKTSRRVPGVIAAGPDLDRTVSHIIYSRHARCRMDCRHITKAEVEEILQKGTINQEKIERDSRGITYPLEGISQGHHLRIVFAPKGEDAMEVVTCIDLDTDWPCSCN